MPNSRLWQRLMKGNTMSINNVVLMGRLTYQPELKTTVSGLSVIRFALACDRNKDSTDFIDCEAWRQTAEFIDRYFNKGDMLALQGYIKTDNFTDKDGKKRKSVTVVANNVSFCGGKSDNVHGGDVEIEEVEVDDDEDDLPWR